MSISMTNLINIYINVDSRLFMCFSLCVLILYMWTAFCVSAIALILTGYFGNDTTAVLYLTIALGVTGFSLSGYCVNHIDIAPRFAGVLMGITNMAGTIPGFVGPQVAKALTPNVSKPHK